MFKLQYVLVMCMCLKCSMCVKLRFEMYYRKLSTIQPIVAEGNKKTGHAGAI